MFKKKLLSVFALALALGIAFTGCGSENEAPSSGEVSQEASSSEAAGEPSTIPEVSDEASVIPEVSEEAPSEAAEEEILLYIGSGDTFNTYEADIEGEVTPDKLIAAMGELTGWDLSLADEVTSGKGGMTVSFSKDSALFVGPPMEQKDEFHVFDSESLTMMILDSVQKTLRSYYVLPEGDQSNLDIYYCTENNEPLELPNGMCFPLDEPYSFDKMYFKN